MRISDCIEDYLNIHRKNPYTKEEKQDIKNLIKKHFLYDNKEFELENCPVCNIKPKIVIYLIPWTLLKPRMGIEVRCMECNMSVSKEIKDKVKMESVIDEWNEKVKSERG